MKYLLTIIALAILMGCGARKSLKSEIEVTTASKDTTMLSIQSGKAEAITARTDKHERLNINWSAVSGALIPINPAAPMTVTDQDGNTITFNNAAVSFSQSSGHSTKDSQEQAEVATVKKDTISVATAAGKDFKKTEKAVAKVTDKKASINWNILLWCIGIFGGAALFLYIILARRKHNENNKNTPSANLERTK
jgi:ABC-type Fe3+-hydroxamate transport system substrate-binding protein